MRFPSFLALLLLVRTASHAISTADLSGLEATCVNNIVFIYTCLHNPPRMDQPLRKAKCRIFPHALGRLPPDV